MPWSGRQVDALRSALLDWYRSGARDLPWRRTRDPYRVWVSEILLQQTRVETVVDYYNAFIERFPDVATLARAPLEDVLHAWSGLGYYRRARNMHSAARVVTDQCKGDFPSSATALRKLPGVGAYTAGAIASIAFNEPAAAVDGNIKRVYARLALIEEPIEQAAALRRLWALAEIVLAPEAPGDFNQALMELGARVCLPKEPRCDACPLRRWCVAREAGAVERVPVVKKKQASPVVQARAAAVANEQERYLLVRRSHDGLLAGMWTLPTVEARGRVPTLRTLADALRAEHGVGASVGQALGSIRHVFTHRVLEARVHRAQAIGAGARLDRGAARWLTPAEFESVPLASVDRKLLRLIPGAVLKK